MSHNPWARLASYQDPASGSTLGIIFIVHEQ